MSDLPLITVVIPNLNCADYLERTIRSVLDQGYPALELIMVDGGSTDGSLGIIDKYRPEFAQVIIGPDTGQGHAINKGMAVSTGAVMSWINSDDMLAPGSLHTVGRFFADNPSVSWVVGNSTLIDEEDRVTRSSPPDCHTRIRFLAGDYQWIQQESCFWRRDLWERAGAGLDEQLRLAVDGDLWLRFFEHAQLHGLRAQLGAFRVRSGQRSEAIEAYHAEMLERIRQHRLAVSEDYVERYSDILASDVAVRARPEVEMEWPSVKQEDVRPGWPGNLLSARGPFGYHLNRVRKGRTLW